jgi:hypothetical protein
VMAGATAPEPPSARIDELLRDGSLDDEPLDAGSLDDDPFDRDPDTGAFAVGSLDDDPVRGEPGEAASTPPGGTAQPTRPRPVRPLTIALHDSDDGRPGRGKGPFRLVGGEGDAAQPRRQRALDVVMDARMRFWRERVAIMLVAGLLFGFLAANWVVGLTLAIIAGIAHAIWRSRAVAALPPGVKLTRAQRITQRKLAHMERAGYRALHARPIPGSEDVIDHLVVGPTGVYAIDSEKWNRKLPIRTRNGKQLWLGPTSQKPRLEHAKSEAARAAELLSAQLGREITVRAALAIYGPHIPWDIAVIRDVDVFNGDRLRRYLKRRSRVREVTKLSREEITRISEAAAVALPFVGVRQEAPVG